MTKNRACGVKTRHQTREAAEDHMRHLIRNGARPGALNVYGCSHCGFFHVGHKPRRRR